MQGSADFTEATTSKTRFSGTKFQRGKDVGMMGITWREQFVGEGLFSTKATVPIKEVHEATRETRVRGVGRGREGREELARGISHGDNTEKLEAWWLWWNCELVFAACSLPTY